MAMTLVRYEAHIYAVNFNTSLELKVLCVHISFSLFHIIEAFIVPSVSVVHFEIGCFGL